jgi:dienelactone hydrolase
VLVSFPSGEETLHGYLHRPDGDGPLPAIVWNHGSERSPGSRDELGAFYTTAGYVLFVPHRRGHGHSPGDHFAAVLRREANAQTRGRVVESLIALHELHLQDTLAAAAWLARQPFVDPGRIAMSGVSHGAIQTVLAAEAGGGVRAYVPFAPAAIAWSGNPELHDRLLRAVGSAEAPIFLLQAENDYSLGPSEVLGEELRRKGGLNRTGVYPAYGATHESGHGEFACVGTDVWGKDVGAFLAEALGAGSAAEAA